MYSIFHNMLLVHCSPCRLVATVEFLAECLEQELKAKADDAPSLVTTNLVNLPIHACNGIWNFDFHHFFCHVVVSRD